jgi:MinD-like ATPase involved in chromosome partitioning or flagellar assembly
MAVLALVSAKGSPGATTTTAALGAAAASGGESALVVELDPSGGDIAMLCDRIGESALVELAEELRHGTPAADTVPAHAVEAPPGVPAVLAPSGANEASGVIASLDDRWLPALRRSAAAVVVDAGRWEPRGSAARRIAGADVVGVVCRSTAPSVEHARRSMDALRGTARCPVAVVVVGGRPYPGEEVAAALDVPLAGVLAWDPRGVTTMWERGERVRGRRSWLARSALTVLDGLVAQVPAARMDGRPGVGSTAGDLR